MSQDTEASPEDQSAPFTPPALDELERMLPQYEITSLIAHGGMGAVYSGIQRDLDRPVAIKILPPEMGRDQESVERFRTEAKAMARLTHPNIPTVFDFAVVEDHCVLVMELVDGPNVYTLIRQGQVSPPRALEIMAQICEAAQFAHTRGIIHGDIKPGNILINADGQAKLADFGLARLAGSGDSWSAMGTPEYAAPELYDKHARPDHRADIYSLGVVLHEMLTGSPPVGEFELPAEGMGLDPRVDEVIAKCMELSPENRYQSASDIRAVVRDIIEKRNVPAPLPAKKAPRKITRAGRRVPTIVKARGPSSQGIAGAAPRPAAVAPGAEVRPVVARRPGGKKRVRKVVVGPGGSSSSGLSDDAKRGILIGIAVLVMAVAAWILLSGGNKTSPEPSDKEETTEPQERPVSVSTDTPSKTDSIFSSTSTTPPPPPVKKPAPETPATPRTRPTKFPEKFQPMRSAWRDQWNKKVEDKFQPEFTRTGDLYLSALQKLEDASLGKGDAATVLAIRTERQRWESGKEPPPAAAISQVPELAKLQNQLAAKLTQLRADIKYDSDKVKEEYLVALKALERVMNDDADKEGGQLAADEFTKVTGMDDRALAKYFNAP